MTKHILLVIAVTTIAAIMIMLFAYAQPYIHTNNVLGTFANNNNVNVSINAANITDGEPRITLVEEEDHSFSLYETINGTTVQVDSYDSFRDFINAKYADIQDLDRDRELYQQRQLAVQMNQLNATINQLIQALQAQFTFVFGNNVLNNVLGIFAINKPT